VLLQGSAERVNLVPPQPHVTIVCAASETGLQSLTFVWVVRDDRELQWATPILRRVQAAVGRQGRSGPSISIRVHVTDSRRLAVGATATLPVPGEWLLPLSNTCRIKFIWVGVVSLACTHLCQRACVRLQTGIYPPPILS
jgi:hypothetical protein